MSNRIIGSGSGRSVSDSGHVRIGSARVNISFGLGTDRIGSVSGHVMSGRVRIGSRSSRVKVGSGQFRFGFISSFGFCRSDLVRFLAS